MAHFAKIDDNNIVIQVIVINNEILIDENGQEQESLGIAFCKSLYGEDTNWIQTSYNENFRANYAGIGFIYDEDRDIFIPPKTPYSSWILNTTSFKWEPPIPYPTDDKPYIWQEESQSWIEKN